MKLPNIDTSADIYSEELARRTAEHNDAIVKQCTQEILGVKFGGLSAIAHRLSRVIAPGQPGETICLDGKPMLYLGDISVSVSQDGERCTVTVTQPMRKLQP